MGTVPGLSGITDSALFEQSRSSTEVTVIDPVPPATVLDTATLNRLPVWAVGPHEGPSTAPSTVYDPPPLSMTWNVVGPAELRYVPSVMLEGVHSWRLPDSCSVTLYASIGIGV